MSQDEIDLREEGKQALYVRAVDGPREGKMSAFQAIAYEFGLSTEDVEEVSDLIERPGFRPNDRIFIAKD